MSRLNVLLLIAVMASAFYLVKTQYDSRRLYTEFDRSRSEARNLELERERLEVERRSQGTSLRVEKVAKEELHMRSVTPAITQYVYRPLDESGQASQAAKSKQGSTETQSPSPSSVVKPSAPLVKPVASDVTQVAKGVSP
jgi:cell division protein FtsL